MKPLSHEHNLRTRNKLAEQGIEMTTDEVVEHRKAAFQTIRVEMRKHGYDMPDSDEELFELLREELPHLTNFQEELDSPNEMD